MYFLQNAVRIFGLSTRKISKKALAVMENYDWPGNIHQIKNVIEHALIMASNQNTIKLNCLPSELVSYNVNENFGSAHETNFIAIPLKEAKEKFERDYLQAQIKRFSGNISKTASFIGMERSALHRKLKGLRLKHDKKGTSYE